MRVCVAYGGTGSPFIHIYVACGALIMHAIRLQYEAFRGGGSQKLCNCSAFSLQVLSFLSK